MAKWLAGAANTKVEIFMPPKRLDDGSWRWAQCQWTATKEITDGARAAISLAPRIPDMVAVIAFPFFGLFIVWVAAFWFLLMGGGCVDFIVGSIGKSAKSDLQKAALYLNVSVWPFRFVATMFVLYDILVGLYLAGWFRV
jgi:hypothetical protein